MTSSSSIPSLTGRLLIGRNEVVGGGPVFHGFDPSRNATLEPSFVGASGMDIDAACRLAEAAFDGYRTTSATVRATFLDAIAAGIDALGAPLIDRAMAETGLPRGRLEGERGRTTGQLRMFATIVREGLWRQIAIDTPLPDRKPGARSDLRQSQIALGPVAVFGASNFPLAFSVAGGDTAAALAAGCPVVHKAHPSHPGTAELVGRVIRDAVAAHDLPEGVFSLVGGTGHDVGTTLVAHPAIRAVGFTGSRVGGLALVRVAQARPEPIPVYAEMSAINPVIVLPRAMAARGDVVARQFVDSLALGTGQFCTNPGVVLGIGGADWDRFIAAVAKAVASQPAGTMLNPSIHHSYRVATAARATTEGVTRLASGEPATEDRCAAQVVIDQTTAATWLANAALEDEIFGPSSLLIRCDDLRQLQTVIEHLSGQLTATLQVDPGDLDDARALMPVLARKVGRILANGFPTGVEVGYAMVHGGPYPATSDSRGTSVGASAIARFLRPVCYQDLPAGLLPPELQDAELQRNWRLVDGVMHAPG